MTSSFWGISIVEYEIDRKRWKLTTTDGETKKVVWRTKEQRKHWHLEGPKFGHSKEYFSTIKSGIKPPWSCLRKSTGRYVFRAIQITTTRGSRPLISNSQETGVREVGKVILEVPKLPYRRQRTLKLSLRFVPRMEDRKTFFPNYTYWRDDLKAEIGRVCRLFMGGGNFGPGKFGPGKLGLENSVPGKFSPRKLCPAKLGTRKTLSMENPDPENSVLEISVRGTVGPGKIRSQKTRSHSKEENSVLY